MVKRSEGCGLCVCFKVCVAALDVLDVLCNALPKETLRVLDLSENALGEKGIRRLESCLRSLVCLEEICFYNNGLSELSLKLLVGMLPASSLKKLHFHNNMSGDGGAKAVAEVLPSLAKLEVIVGLFCCGDVFV